MRFRHNALKMAILFCVGLNSLLFGCSAAETAVSSEERTMFDAVSASVSREVGDNRSMLSQDVQTAGMTIYEITENNFQNGLYYRFSETEVSAWQDVIKSGDYTTQAAELTKENTKYIIEMYDSENANIAFLRIDQNLRMYTEDGNMIVCEKLENMLNDIVRTSTNCE